MTFSSIVGQEDAKLALILNAIDPRCGVFSLSAKKVPANPRWPVPLRNLPGKGDLSSNCR